MKPPIVFLNGLYVELKNARVSILDRGFCYGDGLFETMRAYGGKVFRADLHLERLFHSAAAIRIDIPATRGELGKVIHETIERNGLDDAYVRLTLTRGEADSPGLRIGRGMSPTLAVYVKPCDPLPEAYYEKGVAVSFFPAGADRTYGAREQVKSCNYLSRILIRDLAARRQAFEGILLDDRDQVTEGTVSNIFMVKDGTLLTPPASSYILPGITRSIVLEIARADRIPCREQTITANDLRKADEAFLTNSLVELLPVCRADAAIIGNGKPGKITARLREHFGKTVESMA